MSFTEEYLPVSDFEPITEWTLRSDRISRSDSNLGLRACGKPARLEAVYVAATASLTDSRRTSWKGLNGEWFVQTVVFLTNKNLPATVRVCHTLLIYIINHRLQCRQLNGVLSTRKHHHIRESTSLVMQLCGAWPSQAQVKSSSRTKWRSGWQEEHSGQTKGWLW